MKSLAAWLFSLRFANCARKAAERLYVVRYGCAYFFTLTRISRYDGVDVGRRYQRKFPRRKAEGNTRFGQILNLAAASLNPVILRFSSYFRCSSCLCQGCPANANLMWSSMRTKTSLSLTPVFFTVISRQPRTGVPI